MQTAGIGQNIKSVAGLREGLYEFDHGGIGFEDFAPDSSELVTRSLKVEDAYGFCNEGFVVDLAGLELLFDGLDGREDVFVAGS